MSVWVLQEADTENKLSVEEVFFVLGEEEIIPVKDKVKGSRLSRENFQTRKKI